MNAQDKAELRADFLKVHGTKGIYFTTEQLNSVLSIIESDREKIAEMEEEIGLLKIAYESRSTLLNSCAHSLVNRDEKIQALTEQLCMNCKERILKS